MSLKLHVQSKILDKIILRVSNFFYTVERDLSN